jgi:CRISPR-associated protein Csh1
MNIVISWLNIVTKLKGGINKMEGNNYIPILNSDLEEFFKIHNDIYEKNYFKQGLVMLGMLINQVKKEQKEKSSTIIDRINFDGIPARRLNNLIKDVTEYLKIYKIFDVNGLLYSQAIDRLQGIEKSEMNKDEILFYILTGVGVSRYLSFKYSKDKKNNKVNETNIEEESNNE